MKKIITLLLTITLSNCTYYQSHIRQANYVYCRTDDSIVYKIDNVKKVVHISADPQIDELTYNDNSTEQFFGSCYIPTIEVL